MKDRDSTSWVRVAPWIVLLVILVLVLPAISFVRNRRAQGESQEGSRVAYGQPFDGGRLYEVRHAFSVPIGEEKHAIALNEGGVSFETVLSDGVGGYWLVDHPAPAEGGARVRRLDAQGRVRHEFSSELGSTLFTPGLGGDLWFDVAAGGGKTETFVRVDARGKELARYVLPEGLFARNVCVAPDGAVYAQVEEWMIDPEQRTGIYDSHLVPIADANGRPVEKPMDKAVNGSFIGSDGLIYELKGEGPLGQDDYPAFSIIARDASSTAVRTYRLPEGLRPYAADSDGRVYAEARPPVQPQSFGVSSLGDASGEVSLVHVFDEEGLVAVLPAAWPVAVNTWYPSATPRGDGSLVAYRWDADELAVLDLRPIDGEAGSAAEQPGAADARVLVTTGMPYCGDPYLAEDVAQRDLWQLVYSGLVTHDASLTPVPGLAERVPVRGAGVSDDGLEVTWRIAEGRTWHDGRAVTPRDVVATWEHLKTTSPVDRPQPFPGFDLITDVVAEGDEVRVSLSEPFGPAPEAFFPYVLPAHILEAGEGAANGGVFSMPVGSGPYRLERWEAADGRWMLSAHGGKAGIDRLDILFVDAETVADDYIASPIPTLWTWLTPDEATTMRRDAVGTILSIPTGRWWGTLLNSSKGSLRDRELRDALVSLHPMDEIRSLYGLDQEYTDRARPFAVRATGNVARSSDVTASIEDLTDRLRDAGWKREAGLLLGRDGERVRLRYELTVRRLGEDEILSEQVDAVLAAWNRIGVDAGWNYSRPWYYASAVNNGYLSGGLHDVGVGVFPGFIDPAWGSVFDPGDTPSRRDPRGLSVTFAQDSELERLHRRARESYDSEERSEIGDEIRERAEELSLVVFERPEERENAVLGIAGYSPGPYPAGDFWNAGSWTTERRR